MNAIVVMGVAGCGKSSVGVQLAARFHCLYVEGDDLHDQSSINKMSNGYSLTDADREPWLQRVGEKLAGSADPVVVSCSALKRAYRDTIRLHSGRPVMFIHLSAPQAVIASRMKQRVGHFMPPELLASQFQTLEPLSSDEQGSVIDITQTLELSINDASKVVERYFK